MNYVYLLVRGRKMNGRIRNKSNMTMLLILMIGAVLLENVATKQTRGATSRVKLASTYLNLAENYHNYKNNKTRSSDFDIYQDQGKWGKIYLVCQRKQR